MHVTTQSAKPLHKLTFTILAAAILILIASAFFWLQSGKAAADPAVTEHRFEAGSATWSINPYSAQVLHNNLFTLTLIDPSGVPMEGAKLHITLEMIGMLCGDYSFELIETSPGTYSGDGIPLMAGLWKATLSLTDSAGNTSQISRTLKATQ